MAGSVNKVILVGNVGKDPEIRRTQDGRPIANLSLATSETWRDKNTGERKEKTEWHRVVVFSEPLCKVIEQYVKKGAKLYIEGALQTRKWTDKDGVEKYSTEVVLQGFNGTMTMLDGRQGAGCRAGGMQEDSRVELWCARRRLWRLHRPAAATASRSAAARAAAARRASTSRSTTRSRSDVPSATLDFEQPVRERTRRRCRAVQGA